MPQETQRKGCLWQAYATLPLNLSLAELCISRHMGPHMPGSGCWHGGQFASIRQAADASIAGSWSHSTLPGLAISWSKATRSEMKNKTWTIYLAASRDTCYQLPSAAFPAIACHGAHLMLVEAHWCQAWSVVAQSRRGLVEWLMWLCESCVEERQEEFARQARQSFAVKSILGKCQKV